MSRQIVIVAPVPPSPSLIEDIKKAAGPDVELLMLHHYPSRGELRMIGNGGIRPSAFLVDCADDRQGFRVLRDLGQMYPDVITAVLNGSRRLSALVRAKQAGASAYVSNSHSSTDLRRLAVHLSADPGHYQTEHSDGRLVSFLPAQGGSGASTIALHVATAVARSRQGECLLVDFDLHTGTVGFQLGLQPKHSLISVMSQPELSKETLRQACTTAKGLDVIVSSTDEDILEPSVFRKTNEFLSIVQNAYRYAFVDLPAATLSSAVDVLKRSHLVYLVCTPEITSLHLALRKVSYLDTCGVPADNVRLLINRASSWGGLDMPRIENVVGKPVEWLIDNDYPAIRESALRGGLVSAESALSAQFAHLAIGIVHELACEPATVPGPSGENNDVLNSRVFA